MKLKVFAFLLTLLSSTALWAQTQLPEDDKKMLSELANMLDANKKGAGKDLVEGKLSDLWLKQMVYTETQKSEFRKTLEVLIAAKNKTPNDLYAYVEAMVYFPTTAQNDAYFTEWSEVIRKTYTDKKIKKNREDLLMASAGLFKDGTLYTNSAGQYSVSSTNYSFKFDSLPHIFFPSLKLMCTTNVDSAIIYDASGNFFPTLENFVGTQGRITWKKCGMDPNKTYATFNGFTIRVKNNEYEIKDALFHSEFYSQPLSGIVTDKASARKGENENYPQFDTYQKRLNIQNLQPGVHYEGGFSVRGKNLLGSGTPAEPASLNFDRENKPFLTIQSLEFKIEPERIFSKAASLHLRLDSDSIYHPQLDFVYDTKAKTVKASRTEDGKSPSPFENSYHEVEMYFQTFQWNLADPQIRFIGEEFVPEAQTSAGGEATEEEMARKMQENRNSAFKYSNDHVASFESYSYFKKNRYQNIGQAFNGHPLALLGKTVTNTGSSTFYAVDLARTAGTGVDTWIPVLFDLQNKGYIEYNPNNRQITVLEKTYRHLNNNRGEEDYDALQFFSQVQLGENATLSLLNKDLTIRGVENVLLSDSQSVMVFPRNGEIILQKERDFEFSGSLSTGDFELVGAKFTFIYDQFKFELTEVDSCLIYVNDRNAPKDMYGNFQKRRVRNVLNNLSGTLQVDNPANKSGFHSKDYPQYPILNCNKTSTVFWNKQKIQGGAYGKDIFYYEVDPFEIDSLDNFDERHLNFIGNLVSGGIFPDIKEPLVLMDDYSLGFHIPTPAGGFQAYGGKAKVTGDLTLNQSGLRGQGELNYLTSTATSDLFTYLPERTFGSSTSYKNEEDKKAEVPSAFAANVEINFWANKNRFDATTTKEEITFFGSDATFAGTSHLGPEGMTGAGTFHFIGASLTSQHFHTKTRKALADTAEFELAGKSGMGLMFQTDNVSADVDFDKRNGKFKSNSGESKITFPTNQYICFMDEFTWYMDKAEMDLSSSRRATSDLVIDTDAEKKRSNFYSIASGQDSLNFLSPFAKFDLDESRLTCQKIQYIIVADSKVQPDSNYVVIEKNANMRTLERAQVISNFVTQYHKIFNAEVKITGRKKYEGFGDMVYRDENKKEQIIHLTKFKLDSTYQTIGYGEIKDSSEFFLSPAFEYQGKFNLFANNPNLTFDGGVRILHNCANVDRTFFKFKSEINPLEIYIPVDSAMKDLGSNKLGAGLMIQADSPMDIYPAFLSKKKLRNDKGLIEATGFLYYDKGKKLYYIGSKEKIRQPKLPGQLLTFNTANCDINGDGKMSLNTDFGMMTMQSAGVVNFKSSDSTLFAQSSTLINFPFDEGLQKYLAEKLIANNGLDPVDLSRTQFEKGLIEFLGSEKSDKLIADMALDGTIKRLPEELQQQLYLADVKWKWNEENETFTSTGPIGIAAMGKRQIFKYVKGIIVVEKRKTGDIITIYLEPEASNWYLFEYRLGVMSIVTSDNAFATQINELKPDAKKFEEGRKKFSFTLIAQKKKQVDLFNKYPELDINH